MRTFIDGMRSEMFKKIYKIMANKLKQFGHKIDVGVM
jgi:hypothetical protein